MTHASKIFVYLAIAILGLATLSVLMLPKAQASDCIPTDVKGSLNYSGDHMSGNPVTGTFENIASNPDCSDDIYVHVFGTNDAPTDGGWLDHQVHLKTDTFTIPQASSSAIEVSIPESNYCWYQVDATRTSDVKVPPIYNGDDMIDYVYVQGPENCGDVTPTPTATPSASPTPTNSNNNGGGSSSSSSSSSSNSNASNNEAPKSVASIQAAMGTSTMANTGEFTNTFMNFLLSTGMIVSSLGAISYVQDKKAKLV